MAGWSLSQMKKMATKFITNNENYSRADSGCAEASEFLGGEASLCLECPFPKCIHEKVRHYTGRPRNTERDREIVSSDKTIKELSIKYNLSKQRIKGIVKRGMDKDN